MSKPTFQVLYICLFLFISTLTFHIVWATETDYDKWISWHVKNYKEKNVIDLVRTEKSTTREKLVDLKLEMAEMNKMEISVSQDGTNGHFKTINEAILSIPRYNTRRVIVRINSGVYR